MKVEEMETEIERVTAQFESSSGVLAGLPLDLPINISVDRLRLLCNKITEKGDADPCIFFVNDKELTQSLGDVLNAGDQCAEKIITIVYQHQALFNVRPVTRCTSSMPGHAEAVVSVAFSPDGRKLASGSGDTTVRFWDLDTQTPHYTCKGHKNWVLVVSWDPLATRIASGCKNGEIFIWDAEKGVKIGKELVGHKQWITAIVWEPLHCNEECRHIASSSKDMTIRIWDVILGNCLRVLSGHTASVTSLKWGGSGVLYSGSQDRTIKTWNPNDGVLITTLIGHGHWVNALAVNSDQATRCGPFGPKNKWELSEGLTKNEILRAGLARYTEMTDNVEEKLVSASDDFTLILWAPPNPKPIARMHGHQQLINDVKFSPSGRLIVSASFDKSIKIWNAKDGGFVTTLRGHVKPVYQIAFSPDSKMLISGSADSTLKLWNMSSFKLELDLPGHADEVFAVDWAPDGQCVASGGKDKILKLWRN